MTKEIRLATQAILDHVTPTPTVHNGLSDQQKVDIIAGHFKEILTTLGLDLENDSLKESPTRIARMYVHEVFKGLNPEHFPKITVIENDMKYDQMIVVRDVTVLSTCEHHFVTIDGKATIAYIPNKKVIGLSKINRIADFFSRRPQVQERLTKQIADCLTHVLETENVAVHINARHYCVISRGVQDSHSTTITSDLRGDFKRLVETRSEFLSHCTTKTLGLEL
ncbi:MAG: GTP cyclohydrolase I FolE [Bdellovibrionaceae bacterium]|nr:GTP cyclohydrolase I FolE [Pseudobdellovibrionaceae bacterium]